MHLLDQTAAGILILVLLGVLVVTKRRATGSILDKTPNGLLARAVNAFNLFFLLIVNPVAAALLLAHRIDAADPGHIVVESSWLLVVFELGGAALYVAGHLFMDWALIGLGRTYQLGGSFPRPGDAMISGGPYRLVRHPMYAAALGISLGLALMIQSLSCLFVLLVYCAMIPPLVRVEEEGLRRAYGEKYREYARGVSRLVPYLY